MARNTKRAERPANEPNTAQLRDRMPSPRTTGKAIGNDPAAAPFDTGNEVAGRSGENAAVKRALAEEKLRRAQEVSAHARRSPVGSLGRMALLIGLTALAGLLVAWLLLVA